ncbi:MAG: tetratricopeptide repeat protein [Planctomycetota bacterium]
MRTLSAVFGIVTPVVLSIVPGWGHIWLRRGSTGLMIFMLFFAAINLALLTSARILPDLSPVLGRIAYATAASAFAFSVLDVLRATIWSRSRPVRERRRRILRRAIAHSIRGEDGQAQEQLEHALRIDPNDPAAWAWLGALLERGGRTKDARRALKRARFLGAEAGWREVLDHHLAGVGGRG